MPNGWRDTSYKRFVTKQQTVKTPRGVPPVEVRKSHIHGVGVFATRNIAMGELVCVFTGTVFRDSAANYAIDAIENKTCVEFVESLKYNFTISANFEIRASRTVPKGPSWNVGQFANDAICIDTTLDNFDRGIRLAFHYTQRAMLRNNMVAMPFPDRVEFYATRNVALGEELTYTYGATVWALTTLVKPETRYDVLEEIMYCMPKMYDDKFILQITAAMTFVPEALSPICKLVASDVAQMRHLPTLLRHQIANTRMTGRVFAMLFIVETGHKTVTFEFDRGMMVLFWPNWREIPEKFFEFMSEYSTRGGKCTKKALRSIYRGRMSYHV